MCFTFKVSVHKTWHVETLRKGGGDERTSRTRGACCVASVARHRERLRVLHGFHSINNQTWVPRRSVLTTAASWSVSPVGAGHMTAHCRSCDAAERSVPGAETRCRINLAQPTLHHHHQAAFNIHSVWVHFLNLYPLKWDYVTSERRNNSIV